jgi:hypothetical protein
MEPQSEDKNHRPGDDKGGFLTDTRVKCVKSTNISVILLAFN